MTKALIFDFFGVICSEVAPVWIKTHLPNESAEELHERYIRSVDEGAVSDVEMFRTLANLANTTEEKIRKEWHDLISIDQDLVTLIKNLKATYKIGLCSNAWSSFIDPILEENNLSELFDTIVISCEVHVTKPNQLMYETVLSELGIESNEAIFIDDDILNIQGAERAGMRGILFTSVEDLEAKI